MVLCNSDALTNDWLLSAVPPHLQPAYETCMQQVEMQMRLAEEMMRMSVMSWQLCYKVVGGAPQRR